MNTTVYTFLPLLIVIITGSLLLKWQERKHNFESSLFYTYEQLQQQILIPKRDFLDSWLIVFIGAMMVEFGGLFLWSTISLMSHVNGLFNAQTKNIVKEITPRQLIFSALVLGSGIALLILGIRSVIANRKYQRHLRK